MKRLAVAMMAIGVGWCVPGLGQVVSYRDSDQNIYLEGLPPNQPFKVSYIPDPSQPDRRYKSAWMYKSSEFCNLHHLWHTAKFPIADQVMIFGTAYGDVTLNSSGAGAIPFTSNHTPCNGNQPNNALPWQEIIPESGIKAVRSYNPCRFNYMGGFNGDVVKCAGLNVMYISGLPNPAYRVSSSSPEIRFTKSNGCGFLKLANTQKWQAYPKDRFNLTTHYEFNHPNYQDFGQFNRGNLAYRTFEQIPRCFDGKRYMHQP